MTTTTWRKGIDQIIEQGETKVYKRELLNSICKELENKGVSYDIHNTSADWTIKIK
jgi:hypothetical protein